jgi:hypothetical protein
VLSCRGGAGPCCCEEGLCGGADWWAVSCAPDGGREVVRMERSWKDWTGVGGVCFITRFTWEGITQWSLLVLSKWMWSSLARADPVEKGSGR